MASRLRSFAVGGLGIGLVLVGLAVLAFNGYVEDYGAEPLRTWPIAVPMVSVGMVLLGVVGGRRHLIIALPIVTAATALKLLLPSLALPGLVVVALAVVLAVREAERRRATPSASHRAPVVALRTESPQRRADTHPPRPRSPQPVDGIRR